MAPVTRTLIIVNCLVFMLERTGTGLGDLALWPPGSGFAPTQLLTYGFLHGGLTHLAFNMLGLYTFGSAVEQLFGRRFFILYYLASVVVAGITHLVITSWIGGPQVPMVGASGGVYGLLLAFGVFFPTRVVVLLIPPIPMKARTFVVVFAAVELLFGVTGTASGVAHFAHLGGMLGGWLMIMWRRGNRPRL